MRIGLSVENVPIGISGCAVIAAVICSVSLDHRERVEVKYCVDRRACLSGRILCSEAGVLRQAEVLFFKMCLNETYNKARIGEHFSDKFSYPECSKTRGYFIATAFQLHFRICH
jgi:hypothetical protein